MTVSGDPPRTAAALSEKAKKKKPTRERLIQAALQLIAKHGYTDATVAEIERSAGLSPGAGGMYRHFASKDELVLAAVKEYREAVLKQRDILQQLGVDSVEEARRVIPKALARFGAQQQAAILAFALEGVRFPEESKKEVAAAWNDGYELFADGLRRIAGDDLENVDVEAAAVQLLSGLSQYVTHIIAFGKPPLKVTLDRYITSWIRNWGYVIEGWRASGGSGKSG